MRSRALILLFSRPANEVLVNNYPARFRQRFGDCFIAGVAEPGLAEMIGHELPSPSAAALFVGLSRGGEDHRRTTTPPAREIAHIPEETVPFAGSGQVNRDLVQRFRERRPESALPRWIRTRRYREPRAGSEGDLRGRARLSAHAGGVGGYGSGAGGPVSRRQCIGADGAVASRAGGFCRPAGDDERDLTASNRKSRTSSLTGSASLSVIELDREAVLLPHPARQPRRAPRPGPAS